MSSTSDLRITVNSVNHLLEWLDVDERVRVTKSYGTRRLEIDGTSSTRTTRPKGPKDCLTFAEGMEAALELLYYGKEREDA